MKHGCVKSVINIFLSCFTLLCGVLCCLSLFGVDSSVSTIPFSCCTLLFFMFTRIHHQCFAQIYSEMVHTLLVSITLKVTFSDKSYLGHRLTFC